MDEWEELLADLRSMDDLDDLTAFCSYTAAARDIAEKYGQTSLAEMYATAACLAAEVLESRLRLADAVDDAINPFQPEGEPERPGE